MLFEKYDPLKLSTAGGKGILEQGNLFQIMNKDGEVDEISLREGTDTLKGGLPNPQEILNETWLRQVYEEMVFIRMADDKFLKLQRQGRMGTYASMKGQEAAQIGSVHALKKEDWVVPAFRELAAMHFHGVPLENMYRYWGGFELGSKMPAGVNVLPVSIPVGTHMLHAVGIAWASKLKKNLQPTTYPAASGTPPNDGDNLQPNFVVVTFFSDGATSEGDFHEAMNFASVFKVPCIFFCQNNQYAISIPRKKQTAAKTLAQKAVAYQVPGMQVDGNDVLATYAVTKEAVARARNGEGPFFIEAVTFRQADHTTADDATKYRPAGEFEYWLDRDPLKRMKIFLTAKKLWDEKWQMEIEARAVEKISKAVTAYENTPIPPPEDIFKYVHAEMTPQMQEQLKNLKLIYGSFNNG